jgi:hypothetical protein
MNCIDSSGAAGSSSRYEYVKVKLVCDPYRHTELVLFFNLPFLVSWTNTLDAVPLLWQYRSLCATALQDDDAEARDPAGRMDALVHWIAPAQDARTYQDGESPTLSLHLGECRPLQHFIPKAFRCNAVGATLTVE